MPAKSKAQQKFMGMVHACQKDPSKCASSKVKKTAKSMSKQDAKDFAGTKHKGLPEKVKKENKANVMINGKEVSNFDMSKNPWVL